MFADFKVVSTREVQGCVDGDLPETYAERVLHLPGADGRVLVATERSLPGTAPRATVVLLHGFAQNRYSWDLSTRSFVNFLARAGYRVLNLELTGHGLSRELGSPAARSFDDYVDDMEVVLKAMADRSLSCCLVGHSLGGAVGYAAAGRVPDAVWGMVGVAGVFHFGRSNVWMAALCMAAHHLGNRLPEERGALGVGFSQTGQLLNRVLGMLDQAFWHFPLAGWVPGSTSEEVLEERIGRGFDTTGYAIFLDMARWSVTRRFDSLGGERYDEAFQQSGVPALVLAGDHDRLQPPSDARTAWEWASTEDRTFRVFSPLHDGGHWGHLDIILGDRAPAIVWPCILEWLNPRSAGSLS